MRGNLTWWGYRGDLFRGNFNYFDYFDYQTLLNHDGHCCGWWNWWSGQNYR